MLLIGLLGQELRGQPGGPHNVNKQRFPQVSPIDPSLRNLLMPSAARNRNYQPAPELRYADDGAKLALGNAREAADRVTGVCPPLLKYEAVADLHSLAPVRV